MYQKYLSIYEYKEYLNQTFLRVSLIFFNSQIPKTVCSMEKTLVEKWVSSVCTQEKKEDALEKLNEAGLSESAIANNIWDMVQSAKPVTADKTWIQASEPIIKKLFPTKKKAKTIDVDEFLERLVKMCIPTRSALNNIDSALEKLLFSEIETYLLRGWYWNVQVQQRIRSPVAVFEATACTQTEYQASKILYHMATAGGMHHLRWLQPEDSNVVPTLIKYSQGILEKMDPKVWSDEPLPNPLPFEWIFKN
jgi:hypothetical protein